MKTLFNLGVLATIVLTLVCCGGGGSGDGSPTTMVDSVAPTASDGGTTTASGGGTTPAETGTPSGAGANGTGGAIAEEPPVETPVEPVPPVAAPQETAPPAAAPQEAAPDVNHAAICRIPLMDDKYLNKILLDRMYKDVKTEEDERQMLARSFEVPPDPVVVTSHVPNDPNIAGDPERDWPLRRIAAAGAWAVARGDSDVVVALLDTGVRADHPDLSGNILSGYDFVNNDDIANDDNGHGTAMAGLIVAHIDNGLGSAGIAPVCRILPVKVADKEGFIDPDNLTKGIRYAADRGVAVICIPGGVAEGDAELQAAVRAAAAKGILLIAAAGSHDDATRADYPAAYDEVLEVAGTEIRDIPSRFCTLSTKAEVAAPAEGDLVTTIANGEYGPTDGTSASAALVAGAAALVKSVNKGLTPDHIRNLLRLSGDDIRLVEFRDRYKARRLNVDRAVRTATTGNGDLLIAGVAYLPASPRKGASLKVTIRAANGGLRPVKDGVIRCRLIAREDGALLVEKTLPLPEIKGLEEREAVIEIAVPDRATACRLEIDLLQGSRTVTTERHGPVEIVAGDAPDLEVVSLETGESDIANNVVEITAVVRNRGNVDVRNSCLAVAVTDGPTWHEVFEGALAPGETRTFRFAWTKPADHRQKIYGIVALVAPAEGETEILDNKMVHNLRLTDVSQLGRVAYTDLPAHEIIIDAPWMVCQGKDIPVMFFVGESGPPVTVDSRQMFGRETRTSSSQLYFLSIAMTPGPEFVGGTDHGDDAIFYDGLSEAPRTSMAGYAVVDADGNVYDENQRLYDVVSDAFENPSLRTTPVELNTLHKIVRVPRAALTIREEDGVDVAYLGVSIKYRKLITEKITRSGTYTMDSTTKSFEKGFFGGDPLLFEWRKMLRVEIHKEKFPTLAAMEGFVALLPCHLQMSQTSRNILSQNHQHVRRSSTQETA